MEASTVPLWLIAAPSVVAIVALITAEMRDRRRLKHEREMRLRDERIAAYRRLLAATTTAHTEREGVNALAAASEEISLLASTDEIDRAASEVWVRYGTTQKASAKERRQDDPGTDFSQALSKARAAKAKFLKLARAELGVQGRSRESFRALEVATPSEVLPGPQEGSQGRREDASG